MFIYFDSQQLRFKGFILRIYIFIQGMIYYDIKKKDVLRLNINIKLWTLNNNDESVSVGS